MIVKGRYEIKFDIIMDNGYKMPFELMKNFFYDYSVKGVISIIRENNYHFTPSEIDDYSHKTFLTIFLLQKYCKKVCLIYLNYRVLDYDKFIHEISDMEKFYLDVKKNKKMYEREFLIESVIT